MTPETKEIETPNLPDEMHSIELFRKLRWSEGVYCPNCHSFHIEKRGPQGKIHRYQCKNCQNNFNDFTNTIFHNSQIPIGKMLYIFFNIKNKTTTELSQETKITRQTIYRIKKLFQKDTK
jgi:transposase-like protein